MFLVYIQRLVKRRLFMGLIPLQAEMPPLLEHHVFSLTSLVCRVLVSFSEVNDLCGDPSGEHGRRRGLRSTKPVPAAPRVAILSLGLQ